MLHFLHKYQRGIFILITIVVVLSFVLAGTQTLFFGKKEQPSITIGYAIDGSSITQKELEEFSRFIGWEDNLCDDGLVQRDFLESGMGSLLAESYFTFLKEELTGKVESIQRYTPYLHPQAPFLSASNVWSYFAPFLLANFQSLQEEAKKSQEITPVFFNRLCELYLEQKNFPGERLRQILSYQQRQYEWVTPDPFLERGDLTLFGFQTRGDWLGSSFIDLISHFVLNGSRLAEQKGYRVTKAEARIKMLENVRRSWAAAHPQAALSSAEIEQLMQRQLFALGLEEKDAVEILRKILLFRRYFNEVGQATWLHPLDYEPLASYFRETAVADLYQLPEILRLHQFRQLLKLQVYLEAVGKSKGKEAFFLTPPDTFYSIEEVEQKFPELVLKPIMIEASAVSKEELARQISLKETWDWELEEENWKRLKEQFPLLRGVSASTKEERFLFLEKLEPTIRLDIDRFARLTLLANSPQKIEEALEKAPIRSYTIRKSPKGEVAPFGKLADPVGFFTLLQQAPLPGTALDTVETAGLEAQQKLSHFTPDGNTFYRIQVVERPLEKEILLFSEADSYGILDELLDRHLEEAYPTIRKKDSAAFQEANGSWKPFQDVKDAVGAKVYQNLLKAIERAAVEAKETLPAHPPLEFYCTHRFFQYMQEAKRDLEGGSSAFLVNTTEKEESRLKNQWRLIQTSHKIKREEALSSSLFTLEKGAWSAVEGSADGDLHFYHLLDRLPWAGSLKEEVLEGQKLLAEDTKRDLMRRILQQLHEKKTIENCWKSK